MFLRSAKSTSCIWSRRVLLLLVHMRRFSACSVLAKESVFESQMEQLTIQTAASHPCWAPQLARVPDSSFSPTFSPLAPSLPPSLLSPAPELMKAGPVWPQASDVRLPQCISGLRNTVKSPFISLSFTSHSLCQIF